MEVKILLLDLALSSHAHVLLKLKVIETEGAIEGPLLIRVHNDITLASDLVVVALSADRVWLILHRRWVNRVLMLQMVRVHPTKAVF